MTEINKLQPYTIAVDFDGTLAYHAFPEIGPPVPWAITTMKELHNLGARLILYTMRSPGLKSLKSGTLKTNVLEDAVDWCKERGVVFDYVNENPWQLRWTSSPKIYANAYVDDAAYGLTLRREMGGDYPPAYDWSTHGRHLVRAVKAHNAQHFGEVVYPRSKWPVLEGGEDV